MICRDRCGHGTLLGSRHNTEICVVLQHSNTELCIMLSPKLSLYYLKSCHQNSVGFSKILEILLIGKILLLQVR